MKWNPSILKNHGIRDFKEAREMRREALSSKRKRHSIELVLSCQIVSCVLLLVFSRFTTYEMLVRSYRFLLLYEHDHLNYSLRLCYYQCLSFIASKFFPLVIYPQLSFIFPPSLYFNLNLR